MLRDWDCFHWPGQTYEVKKEGAAEPMDVLCIADVDADLSEHSLVYDGATPNAMVLKAEREMEAGRANLRLLAFVEDRCRVKLYDRWQGYRASASGVAVPATAAPQVAGERAAGHTAAEEEGDMKGTEFVDLVQARMIESLTRAGKKLSAANEQRLADIREQLQAGHDTHTEAIRLLGDFLAENGAAGASDDDDPDAEQGGSNENAAPAAPVQARASKSGGKGKSSNAKKDNGDTPPPDDEEGDGEADDEEEAAEEEGDDSDGEDKDDAEPPDDGGEGGDDGDGDEDEPTKGKSTKGGKSTKARAPKPAPAPAEPAERELPAEAVEALAFYRRAKEAAVEEALRAAARALGPQVFTEASKQTYRAMLERASVEEVGRFRDDWQALAQQTLSPRGTPALDPNAPGGVRWSDEPTGRGGRQTQARDPGDPAGMIPAGAKVRGGTQLGPAAGQADTSLYTVAGSRRRR
jgi:hypothetical protein